MKTLSGTFAFKLGLLTAIAIVAVLTFRAFAAAPPTPCPAAFPHPKKIVKEIRGSGGKEYADLKEPQNEFKKKFDDALTTLEAKGGQYCIRFLPSGPHATPKEPYKPPHPASIKTDKVRKSEAANTTARDADAANDPNAVYRITSDNQMDIDAVTNCLVLE